MQGFLTISEKNQDFENFCISQIKEKIKTKYFE